jgi:hypothetical protein
VGTGTFENDRQKCGLNQRFMNQWGHWGLRAWDSEVVEVFFFLSSTYHPPWSE